jgi:hypothetical protein
MTEPPAVSAEATRLKLFGPSPLLVGEDTAAYDELLARVSGAVKPADVLEEIWVRDVVDLVWETFRLRRLKVSLLNANAYRGLRGILETVFGPIRAGKVAQEWAQRDRDAIKQVDKLLASADMTMDAVMAETLLLRIDAIERIDRMIMGAEARRNVALREIDRHRASLADRLRRVSDEIVDAQFEQVKAPQITNRNAA